MIPELKMLFALSNEDTAPVKSTADVKLHIVDAQSIDAAREKYRDWWHGRTEKPPIAVVWECNNLYRKFDAHYLKRPRHEKAAIKAIKTIRRATHD